MNHRKSAAAVAVIAAFLASSALAQPASQEQHHTEAAPAPQTMPGGMMPGSGGMPMGGMQQATPGGQTPGAGGMPMMGMMRMMMGEDGMGGMRMMSEHVEGRIAFLKTELKITDAQLPLWNSFSQAMRDNAKAMQGMPGGMMGMSQPATLPDKLAARETMLSGRLDTVRKLKGAVEPLYAALSVEQRKTADDIMVSPMGMMM